MIKRLTSVALVCALLSVILVVPVKVDDVSGSAQLMVLASDVNTSWTKARYNTAYFPRSNQYFTITNGDYWYGAMRQIDLSSLGQIDKNTVVSFSYYFTCLSTASYVNSPTGMSAKYTNHNGQTSTFSVSGSNFTPVSNTNYPHAGQGLQIVVQFDVETTATDPPVPYPISDLEIWFDHSTHYVETGDKDKDVGIYIPSFQVFQSGATSAELSQLREITDAITAGNDILTAMYGDILAVCNAIYERTGSMLQVQQQISAYCQTIVTLLTHLDSVTSDIYALLSQQFALLISTIQTESDDIQSTIDAAIERLIAYFDNAFSSSVNPALPGQSTDISGGNSTVGDAESGYQSSATERFENISANFSGFDGSVLSGVALAGTLFQRLWNVLGDYVVVYTVPLVVAICLTILGRVDRRSKKDDGSAGGDGRNTPDGLGGIPRLPGK